MKHLLSIALLVPALAACKSGETTSDQTSAKRQNVATSAPKVIEKDVVKVASTPCDPGAADLAKKLSDANGKNMDLSKPEIQKIIETSTAELKGKTFAFSNCFFARQGNDEVTFKATADAKDDITCVMKGGEDGNKKFRDAAMTFDMAKLRLDVHGTLKVHGQLEDLELVDCEITPHE